MNDWNGVCPRCGVPSSIHTMSMFSTDLVCLGCQERERAHPDYARARQAEHDAVVAGNYNFAGVGVPSNLLVVQGPVGEA